MSAFVSTSTHATTVLEPAPVAWEEVPAAALKEIDPRKYSAFKIIVSETSFYILTRKSGGISAQRFASAISRSWPLWRQRFDVSIPTVSILDTDQYLGGGSPSEFVLAVYLGDIAPPEVNDFFRLAFGWSPLPTCRQYIDVHYGSFADPLQAYVEDMVIHELGHLIFGFGLTKTPENERMWFALGLGLVYDRLIWSRLNAEPSPLFTSLVNVWREKLSWHPDIDQRLVHPDTTQDKSLGVIRLQSYDHGKALEYLSRLRSEIGEHRFDRLIRRYIDPGRGMPIRYDDFLSLLSSEEIKIVNRLEQMLIVR